MIHQLTQRQTLPASLEDVWAYFATPGNLNEMTPPQMKFEIVRGGNGTMYPGQMIEYEVELLPGVKTRWLTEITQVVPESYFVDEQRIGPYRLWHHEHRFVPVENGVEMTDAITYALPFGPFGELIHALWVRRQLNGIFHFRYQKVEEIFRLAHATKTG